MARRDDDALSWGDDDPTLDTGTSVSDGPAHDRPEEAEFRGPVQVTQPVQDHAAEHSAAESAGRRDLSSAGLLALGVLGGVNVLFAVGWLIGGLRLQPVAGFLVAADGTAPPLWTGGNLVALWLAVLAPLVWFGAVLWLTAGARPWVRWLLLGMGVVLVVPWPFVMLGVVGT